MFVKVSVFVLGSAALAAFSLATQAPSAGLEAGLDLALPEVVPGWSSTSMEPSESEKKILPPDTEMAKRRYVSSEAAKGTEIHTTIVLSGKDRTSIHRPEVCLTGQGWNIVRGEERTIALANGERLAVTCLSVARDFEKGEGKTDKVRAFFVYWFVGSRTTTPDNLNRILSTARDNVLRGENPRWAYVSLISPVGEDIATGGLGADLTLEKVEQWIADTTPMFQRAFEPAGLF